MVVLSNAICDDVHWTPVTCTDSELSVYHFFGCRLFQASFQINAALPAKRLIGSQCPEGDISNGVRW